MAPTVTIKASHDVPPTLRDALASDEYTIAIKESVSPQNPQHPTSPTTALELQTVQSIIEIVVGMAEIYEIVERKVMAWRKSHTERNVFITLRGPNGSEDL